MEKYYEDQQLCLCEKVKPLHASAMELSRRHWDGIAKPLHGLGHFEEMLVKIAGIQGSDNIRIDRKAVVVFCSDNGVVKEGVTQADSSVTAVVTENFAKGTASVNRIAEVAGADVIPIDMGVATTLREPGVRDCKISHGTANLRREPAMTREQALESIHIGMALAGELKDSGYDLLAVGEMGIGNTTTSSAIASVLLGLDAEFVTGRGAGLSGDGLERKIRVIREAIELHQPDQKQPIEVLAALGGYDIGAMTGLLLGGAIYRIPVVLDGMISAVAALLARQFCQLSPDYMLASHLGKEPVCPMILERLGLHPIIHAQMALGEGTGAAMLFPLLDMAAAVYRENNTFSQNQIPAYQTFEGESI